MYHITQQTHLYKYITRKKWKHMSAKRLVLECLQEIYF